MNGRRFGNLGAALLVAGALGLTGHGGATANAQPQAADCKDPAMMSDQKMDGPAMMSDPMMDGPAMMGDSAMMDDSAMMGDTMLRARDGQCLATQTPAIQAAFVAVWGDRAGARWVLEHEAELARLGR